MIQLLHGDCLELMKTIPSGSVDMILQDPPYNTTACKWEWDIMTRIDEFWAEWKRIIKPNGAIVMTASQPFTTRLIASNYKDFRYSMVWNKVSPTGHLNAKKKPLLCHEDIVCFSNNKLGNFTYNPEMRKGKFRNKSPKRSTDEITGRCYGAVNHIMDNFNDDYYPTTIYTLSVGNRLNKKHPTQKPVPLMEYLIKTYTNEGETVFDGFAGSGTTGVACKNLGRKFIGIELDEHYFNVAQQRIEAA